ncbi:MAG: hypothetical protein EAY75_16245 [Bacteroidetes bacterium]|nr:MAG: hypothetical protein EAY75_16245 [Bacteroidota bacterium]
MLTPSLQDIKAEITALPHKELVQLCLQLAKFSKNNKELLGFLLFGSENLAGFIAEVNAVVSAQFDALPSSLYLAKKGIRKISQQLNKYQRYAKNPQVEVETLLNFCQRMKELPFKFSRYPALQNLYESQLQKIEKNVAVLHPELNYDYARILADLRPG